MHINTTFKHAVVFYFYSCMQNYFIFYAFEGHINVGWGPHSALGSPVGQPWVRAFA